jgi:hypothetical protein
LAAFRFFNLLLNRWYYYLVRDFGGSYFHRHLTFR